MAFAALLAAAAVAGMALGPVTIAPAHVFGILVEQTGLDLGMTWPAHHPGVLLSIRVPRVLLGVAVGAALGVSGAVMQGLFRNPLADPGLIGISAGGALAAAATIVFGGALAGTVMAQFNAFALPLAAFGGSVGAAFAIYRLGQTQGQIVVATMLLAGIAINALAAAGIGYLTFLSDNQQLRMLTFWTMGGLARATWDTVLPAVLVMGLPIGLMLSLAAPLNAFLLGEHEARHLGVDTARLKNRSVVLVALAVGAAVSVSGIIGFVGLVVPHVVRMLTGPDHRFVIPGAALLGGALLATADLIARFAVQPAELPVGLVTSAVGAPFFLWLLTRHRGHAVSL